MTDNTPLAYIMGALLVASVTLGAVLFLKDMKEWKEKQR